MNKPASPYFSLDRQEDFADCSARNIDHHLPLPLPSPLPSLTLALALARATYCCICVGQRVAGWFGLRKLLP